MKRMSKMYLFAAILSLFICASQNIFAQTVDEEEIRSVSIDSIRFINYTGPYERIDSLASILAIGSGMGDVISKSTTEPSHAGSRNRYYVVHAVGPEDGKKRDADIIFIGADATVDNIANVRRIISSYLRSAYGYSQTDADTLAVFATVYNAVYRNNMDVFQERYKNVVVQNLTKENCGIALSYREWPGHTEIVIPLYNVARGGLSTVDTSVISDSRVIDSMRGESGKGLDARQQMVDIKEREADEATAAAQSAQQQAVEAQREASAARQEATAARQEAQQTQREATATQREATAVQREAEQAQRQADANPDDDEAQQIADEAQRRADEAQQRADEAQQRADEAQQRADEAQRRADEAQQRADEARNQSAESQAEADKFQTEAQNDRAGIAQDVQEMMREQSTMVNAQSVYGLQLVDELRELSAIVQANAKTGSLMKQSPVTFIRNRTVYSDTTGYIAIAGEKAGNGAVRLVTIDTNTLTISKTGSENVAENSVLVKSGNDYYCVLDEGGRFVVAKYGSDLVMRLKSDVPVKSGTPITDTGDMLMVTDSSGKVCLLNKSDLSLVTGN